MTAMACPTCENSDGLHELNSMVAVSVCVPGSCERDVNGNVTFKYEGWTDTDGPMQQVGVVCRNCGWEAMGPRWEEQLVAAVED